LILFSIEFPETRILFLQATPRCSCDKKVTLDVYANTYAIPAPMSLPRTETLFSRQLNGGHLAAGGQIHGLQLIANSRPDLNIYECLLGQPPLAIPCAKLDDF
jgi:hypothetical protein